MDIILKLLMLVFFVILAPILIVWLLTKGIIWVSMGLFNYNLSDKFWFIFVGIVIFNFLFHTRTNISIK